MPIIGAQHTFNTSISELKIVSLVPSITELLCHLGLQKNIVACTKFCIHPSHLKKSTQQIGGTKNPRVQDIIDLQPDIVMANKEENRKEDVEAISKHVNVHVSDINSLSDFKNFVNELGELMSLSAKVLAFNTRLDRLNSNLSPGNKKSVVYLIWKAPYMAAGKGTYIDSVLNHCGFTNLITENRYPETDLEAIQQLKPDCIFLSSEPYPFKQQDIAEMLAATGIDVKLVDGELFSWYSNRIFHLESHLKALRNL